MSSFINHLPLYYKRLSLLFVDGSNYTSFSSLGLLWTKQFTFKVVKPILEVSAGFWCHKVPSKSFSSLLTAMVQLRIGLERGNWFSLEPSGNEDSEYVIKLAFHIAN
jgi:hypothetical protein